MKLPKPSTMWINWTAVLAACFVTIAVFAQDLTTLDRTNTDARRVAAAVAALRDIDDPASRAEARSIIAAMHPQPVTLRVLLDRHRSSDAFMRTQIESVVAQMRFPDEPEIAFSAAAETRDVDLCLLAIAGGFD